MNKEYVRINWQNAPSVNTPLGEINLNKMDYQIDKNENTLITFDTTKANQSDLLQTIKTVTYDTMTGVFTFTFWNGTVVTADLNVEKIPVSFSMSPQGVITMTAADGTQYTADISELIKTYSFVDGSEIDFTVTTDSDGNKSVTAGIVAGSITGEKLQPNYLADCVNAKQGAESFAGSASSSATSSELSSEDSEAWAVGERNGEPVPSTDPAYENNAKWWAQHGTGGSFAGLSDTNFSNLQNGQIAKYNIITQKWENTEDEGGLLPHFKITSEAGSTVTVVCPDTSVIVPTQTSSGIWQCDVPAYGVYTVHAVLNGDDAVRTVTVDTVKEYMIHDEHYSYTLNVYAPTGSSIIVTGGSETYTGTGAGSTAVQFALHQASTQYTITVTYDGLSRQDTITSSASSGQSGSKSIEFGTINLTLDEDLIGETIVMTNGTATKSKVADSTSMVFYPNATGNWTISCEYEGETYYSEPNPVVVSSLSTPVSAEISLIRIPEGATVTPTDDIQTWLACANITDKSYTTLSEVLADRETFETLIADSNACDYMARSTSWADNITNVTGLVPTMTSDTTPSGVCSADSVYQSLNAWKAFDGVATPDGTSQWVSNHSVSSGSTASGWVQYEFPTVTKVNGMSCTEVTVGPVIAYTLKASNDGTNFIPIISGDSFKKITFVNNTAYKYWRLELTCRNDYGSTTFFPRISELQFFANSDICNNPDAMALIGKYDYCSNALLGNATWAEAICNSDYFESVLNVKVPTMTSNTTPSGECVSSGVDSSYPEWKSFDGNNSTISYPSSGTTKDTYYLGYAFPSPVVVNKCKIYGSFTASYYADIAVYGGNNLNELTKLSDVTRLTTATLTDHYLIFDNSNAYTYYVIKVEDTNAQYIHLKSNYAMAVAELQFYGRASAQTNIIHSAANDTIYMLENGSQVVLTTTNSDGIGTLDFTQFMDGTYTLYSSVAKDPDNLSNDFTKSIRITKTSYGCTTEAYLMPDTVKTLYWWGYMSNDCEELSTANGWTCRSGYSWKTPTYNTNDITLNGGSGNQAYYTGIATKHKLPLGTTVKAVGMGLSIAHTIAMALLNWNNEKAVSSDGNGVDISYWETINTNELKSFISTSEDYAEVVTWVGGRSGKLHAFWYE